MELLVIGIDGADRRIFDGMQMPNLSRLICDGQCVSLTEDLWERGWAKTLTGVDGLTHGGFYMKPLCDGTRSFVQSFNCVNYQAPNLTPLWDLMKARGKKVGFMNVPTTSPAPEVDGFFVGGAGGGVARSHGIDPITVWPRELASELDSMGYIFDTRLLESGIREIDPFFERLKAMSARRTEAFCKLSDAHEVDLGYIAYMSTSRVQYLLMVDLLEMVHQQEIQALESAREIRLNTIQQHMVELYSSLDQQLGILLDRLQPRRCLLVGDHGAVPMEYKVNLNAFLRQIGLQGAASGAGFRASIKKTARSLTPPFLRLRLRRRVKKIVSAISRDTNWNATQAFADRFYGGIYVYDVERFGGTVKSEAEIKKITELIVREFNDFPEAQQHGLTARAYRRHHLDSKYAKQLPDVMVEAPDGYFFESFGNFVERNHNLRKVRSLHEITADMFNGMKGKHPLFCIDRDSFGVIESEDPDDLRLVYNVIDRIMV